MVSSYIRNRTVLVTGSTDGIGLQTAIDLAKLGASVILHGRSEERLNRAMIQLRQHDVQAVGAVVGDFAHFASVRSMAAEIRDSFPELSVLVNNAGIYMNDHVLTQDGWETTWQVNHLAMMLITQELLFTLKEHRDARVVNVSSIAHTRGSIDFRNLNGEVQYDGYPAYSQSKLANILFTYELAERLHGSGITANCLHPGVIGTKLLKAGFDMDGASLAEGAETSVFLAADDSLADVSGKYFVRKQETASAQITYDAELRLKLWDLSLDMINGKESGPISATSR